MRLTLTASPATALDTSRSEAVCHITNPWPAGADRQQRLEQPQQRRRAAVPRRHRAQRQGQHPRIRPAHDGRRGAGRRLLPGRDLRAPRAPRAARDARRRRVVLGHPGHQPQHQGARRARGGQAVGGLRCALGGTRAATCSGAVMRLLNIAPLLPCGSMSKSQRTFTIFPLPYLGL